MTKDDKLISDEAQQIRLPKIIDKHIVKHNIIDYRIDTFTTYCIQMFYESQCQVLNQQDNFDMIRVPIRAINYRQTYHQTLN